jgi:hypothetical protein
MLMMMMLDQQLYSIGRKVFRQSSRIEREKKTLGYLSDDSLSEVHLSECYLTMKFSTNICFRYKRLLRSKNSF